jgi:hypothetical protein
MLQVVVASLPCSPPLLLRPCPLLPADTDPLVRGKNAYMYMYMYMYMQCLQVYGFASIFTEF